jgi:hypothetical protein
MNHFAEKILENISKAMGATIVSDAVDGIEEIKKPAKKSKK